MASAFFLKIIFVELKHLPYRHHHTHTHHTTHTRHP